MRCALEHGGAAPVIVAADADLDRAVPMLVKGGFYHAGQVCVSVQRVFAHRSIVAELAAELAERASRRCAVGDPLLAETEVGPLIRLKEVDRVHEWVEEAVRPGRQAALRRRGTVGHLLRADACCWSRRRTAACSTEEVFGPVVSVYGYDDLDEAIGRANALPWRSRRRCSRATTPPRCMPMPGSTRRP